MPVGGFPNQKHHTKRKPVGSSVADVECLGVPILFVSLFCCLAEHTPRLKMDPKVPKCIPRRAASLPKGYLAGSSAQCVPTCRLRSDVPGGSCPIGVGVFLCYASVRPTPSVPCGEMECTRLVRDLPAKQPTEQPMQRQKPGALANDRFIVPQ